LLSWFRASTVSPAVAHGLLCAASAGTATSDENTHPMMILFISALSQRSRAFAKQSHSRTGMFGKFFHPSRA
jgi:hypothetical protein